ncbi:MAG: alkaline phosphatase family protein [Pseudomonadota bacterium]
MTSERMAVLVVCDSLRADLIDADTAPTLARLRVECAYFSAFRGVFPSTTRTSVASIATGCRPLVHGLLGNTMVIDEGRGLTCLSAGTPDFLDRLRRATGRALARPTLHERVSTLGEAVAMSNVSPGAAYIHDPEGAGYVYHRAGSFGPGRRPLADGLAIEIGAEGDRIMTERFCDEVLGRRKPPYAVLWLSEPDHTGHHTPLGSPEHRRAIGEADRNVARVLEQVGRMDADGERILFAVCSDHGMQTIRRRIGVEARLVEAGFKDSADSSDVVVAPQGTSIIIHLAAQARTRLPRIVDWLRRQDFAGRVVAGEALAELGLPCEGTLCIAVSLAEDDEANAYGVRGGSDVAESVFGSEALPGHGQHGGLGAYEQRPFLVVRGAGIAPGAYATPAGLIDIAPTILRHLGLPMDGIEGSPLARDEQKA